MIQQNKFVFLPIQYDNATDGILQCRKFLKMLRFTQNKNYGHSNG
jgi:hypothetical protein